MRKEIDWSKATKILVSASLVVGGIAYAKRAETQNAWTAFTSPAPECGQALEQPPTYEAIVIFTTQQFGGVRSPINSELYRAAAQAYVEKPSQVILAGNLTGYDVRVIGQQIKLQVRNMSDGQTSFDPDSVQVLSDSVTFAEGMEFLSTKMEASGLESGIGIADFNFSRRLSLLASNFNVDMSMVPVACTQDHTTRATDVDGGDLIEGEKLKILALALDPHGNLTTQPIKFFKYILEKTD